MSPGVRLTVPYTLIVLAVFLTGTASAQMPATTDATARLGGHVTTADGGLSIAGARVEITGGPVGRSESRATATGDDGAYEVGGLPPGIYFIHASRAGRLARSHGQGSPIGISGGISGHTQIAIALRAGQTRRDIDVALPRSGSITVRVVDEFGQPRRGAVIEALEDRGRGERRLMPVVAADALRQIIPRAVETDDRGEVRLYGLAPGEYYLRAIVPGFRASITDEPDTAGTRVRIYPPVYYPGTTSSDDAQDIRLGSSEELHVTIALTPMRSATVRGSVVTEDGRPASGFVVLSDVTGPGAKVKTWRAPLERGTFQFDDVWPGEHVIEKDAEEPDVEGADYDALQVTVNGDDVEGLVLHTKPLRPLRGRIVFEGGAAPSGVEPSAFAVKAIGPYGLSGFAVTAGDWTFTLPMTEGPSTLQAVTPNGWYLDRIRLGGSDVTDTPLSGAEGLELVVTNVAATLEGSVTTGRGDLVVGATVVVLPEDPALRRIGSRAVGILSSNAQGRFRVDGLPSGRYLALTSATRPSGPDDLAALARSPEAARVTLSSGDATTLNFTLPER
jgi:hypothetical protein